METLYEKLHRLFEYKDGNLYRKVSVQGASIGARFGNKNSSGYVIGVMDGKNCLLHRLIFMYFHNYLPQYIDHIDGDKSNNKIENLREASKVQNGYNRTAYANSKSKIKNVYWIEEHKKWRVRLTVNKKKIFFGHYNDIELAELVAVSAREKYHGKFANHN